MTAFRSVFPDGADVVLSAGVAGWTSGDAEMPLRRTCSADATRRRGPSFAMA